MSRRKRRRSSPPTLPNSTPKATTPDPPAPPNAPATPRAVLVIVGALVLVVLFGLALWWLRGRGGNAEPATLAPGTVTAEPLAYTAAAPGETLLTSLPADETGVAFTNELNPEHFIKYTYNGAGVAVGDYDGDGLPDLYLVSEESPNKLFRNLGDFHFEDVTAQAGLSDVTGEGGLSVGAHFADVDNDGDLDLFVTNWKTSNRLFRNEGNGRFTDVTTQAGVGYAGGATTSTFADYDRDGDLDFFVATYRPTAIEYEAESLRLQMRDGQLIIPPALQDRLVVVNDETLGQRLRELGERDLLYRNNGDGTFEEVAQQAGIDGGYWGLSATFTDVDNDGWPDLYVTNDLWSPDGFYHNNGDGTFSPIDPDMVQHTPWFSMGVDFADVNNDGLQDYFVGDMISRDHVRRMTQHGAMDMSPQPPDFAPQLMRNGLYVNNGDGSFSDVAWLADVAASDWTWTAKFADLDLDGWVDLLVTNGMVRDLMDADAALAAQQVAAEQGREAFIAFINEYPLLNTGDFVFRNNGDLTFEEVADEWGFNVEGAGHGAAIADLDADGDLDVVVNYINQPARLFRNGAANPRVAVRLRGTVSNSQGIGARVTLTTDEGEQVRQMTTSGGYLSGHEPLVVFGLGDGAQVETLRVEWPSGLVQTLPNEAIESLDADTLYTLVEPDGLASVEPPQPLTLRDPQFTDVAASAGLAHVHDETLSPYDDFEDDNELLPRRLSTLGPGLAWGDPDADGDDDLYVAGAAGQTGALYRNEGDGSFTDVTAASDGWRPAAEEMAPLWWATDAGTELLLSYSSVEAEQPIGARLTPTGEPLAFEDGGWSDTSEASSGALASADVDGDGDLDLFVGGRVVPGEWPLPAPSRLYANEAGELVDVTAEIAPDLLELGQATGATWSDVDADGDPDLVVATEWGPVRLLTNEGGALADTSAEAGLAAWHGLWTGVVTGDWNGDGHLDFAAGNLGLNTPYRASPDEPATLFAGDVDGNGTHDIIEAYYLDGTLHPLRWGGMVEEAIPFIEEAFDSYHAYAEATLEEIFGERLQRAQRFEAHTLEHSIFFGDGAGHFRREPLPRMAQIFPAYGLAVADLDNDGYDDLYLVGNFHGADHETGMYSGGTSAWLRGAGDGSFTLVPPAESGLLVPEEARAVAVADYDADGWTDIAVALTSEPLRLFRNGGVAGNGSLRVRLQGSPENPTGVGARVTVLRPDGSAATREVQAGSGYLSQSSATLVFGLGDAPTATVTVRWPDGTTATREAAAGETLVIEHEP